MRTGVRSFLAGAALVGMSVTACTPGAGSGTSSSTSLTSTSSPGSTTSSPAGEPTTSDPATSSSTTSEATDAVAACVADLARDLGRPAAIGQLLMVGIDSGARVPGVASAVTTYQLGGVIYLGGWSGAQRVRAASEEIQGLTDGPDLFVAADQEGGQVQQLRGAGFSAIPNATTQATEDPSALRRAAQGWGAELAAVGVNVNLAPVADVVPASIGTANGPIGRFHREYGASAAAATPPMTAFLGGMHDAGIATAVKHFPGIGRIAGNTDTAATGITDPDMTATDPSLDTFAAGIEAGTDFVMVSSAVYPRLSSKQALFAPEIVTGLLRDRMGFTGVVITDDVGAAAALQATPTAERATGFLAAGGDIVLTARVSDIPVMVKAIADKADSDPDFRELVDASVLRVLALKTRRGMTSCS